MNYQLLLERKQSDLKQITAQILDLNNQIQKMQEDVKILTKTHDYFRGQVDLLTEMSIEAEKEKEKIK